MAVTKLSLYDQIKGIAAGGTSAAGDIAVVSDTAGTITKAVGLTYSSSAGLVVNNNAAALTAGAAATTLHVAAADAGVTRILADSYGAANAFSGRRANNTNASKTGVVANDVLVQLTGTGYNSAAAYGAVCGDVRVLAGETHSGTIAGSYITFRTTANGTVTLAEKMRLDNAGNLGIGMSPSYRLDVASAASLDRVQLRNTNTNAQTDMIVINDGTGYTSMTVYGSTSASTKYSIATANMSVYSSNYLTILEVSGNYPLHFATNNVLRMTISANGVGIVATSPLAGLDIGYASASYPAIRLSGATVLSGSGSPEIANVSGFGIKTASLMYDFMNYNATVSRMFIDTSGNVGFFQPSPTCTVDIGGSLALDRLDITLSNGANQNISISGGGVSRAFSHVRISGPTGAFSLGGFASGQNGYMLVVLNDTGQAMTISNEDGGSTAANRITTLTGANVVLRTGLSAATFMYVSIQARWYLVSYN